MQSTPFRVRHGIIVETSNNTSTAIVANNQVLTGSASNALVDLSTTWNTTGNPTAIKLNVTNTASSASSALMDLQVGGSSRFRVAANGNIAANGAITLNNFNSILSSNVASPAFAMGTTGMWSRNNTVRLSFAINGAESGVELGTNIVALASTAFVQWTSGTLASSNPDLFLLRDSSGTLAQRNGVNAQTLRLYGTYTDGSNYERINFTANSTGHYVLGEEGGTGSARPLYLGANNATMVTVAANGNVGIGTTPDARLHVRLPADDYTVLTNTLAVESPNSTGIRLASHLDAGGYGGDIVFRGYSSTYGDLRFVAATGSYNAFAERMRIDSNGRLLLGGVSDAAMDGIFGMVVGSSSKTNAGIAIESANRQYMWYIPTGSSAFQLWDASANSDRITFTAAGNVGIGTPTPLAKLDIYGTRQSSTIKTIGNFFDTQATNVDIGGGVAFGGKYDATNYAHFALVGGRKENNTSGNYAGYLVFEARANGGELTERMRITSTGRVGINTQVPLSVLDVWSGNTDQDINIVSSAYKQLVARKAGGIMFRAGGDTTERNVPVAGIEGWDEYTGADFRGSLRFYTETNATLSERMRITSAGNVGIGTTNPANKLQVDGNVTFNGNRPIFFDSSLGSIKFKAGAGGWATGTFFLGSAATSYGGFGAFGTDDALSYYFIGAAYNDAGIYVGSTNSVGIGTSSPQQKLQVNGNARFGDGVVSGVVQIVQAGGVSTLDFIETNGTIRARVLEAAQALTFSTGGNTERMRIAANGNIGIATLSPNYRLTVSGSGYFANPGLASSTPITGILLGSPGSAENDASPAIKFDVGGGGGGATIYTTRIGSAGGNLIFATDNTSAVMTERVRIDSAGRVGIGAIPSEKLEVAGNVLVYGAAGGGAADGTNIWMGPSTNNRDIGIRRAGSAIMAFDRYSGGWQETMRFAANGNIGVGTTSPISKLHLEGSTTDVTLTVVKTGSGFATYFSNDGTNLWLGSGQGVTGKKVIINQSTTDNALTIDSAGSTIVGASAIATNATGGFLYIPTCAGTPTGTPISYTGRAPLVIDSTNNKLYMYSGGAWVALN